MSFEKNLELAPPPKNIFVTQIKEDVDYCSREILKHPIVKENADTILKKSKNTLQSTLLLLQKAELEQFEDSFQQAKKQHLEKMKMLQVREEVLLGRQKKFDNQTKEFSAYVSEEKRKQRNALNKVQTYTQENQKNDTTLSQMKTNVELFSKKNKQLKDSIAQYLQYKKYFHRVLEYTPEGTFDLISESHDTSIIMRYKTLSEYHKLLFDNLQTLNDEYEKYQMDFALFKQIYEHNMLENNQALSQNLSILDTERGQSAYLDQLVSMKQEYARRMKRDLAQIMLSINNIGDKCFLQRFNRKKSANMPIVEQLYLIQEYIKEQEDTLELAKKITERSHFDSDTSMHKDVSTDSIAKSKSKSNSLSLRSRKPLH